MAKKKKVPKKSEKVLNNVVEKADQIEEKVEELKLITTLKRFGIVIGGAILFSGFLILAMFLAVSLRIITTPFTEGELFLISTALFAEALIQIFGGLALIVK